MTALIRLSVVEAVWHLEPLVGVKDRSVAVEFRAAGLTDLVQAGADEQAA